MLGPLVNPSSPKNHLLGTFNLEVARLYNYILQEEKEIQYGIIHAVDGYDEISLTGGFKFFTKKRRTANQSRRYRTKKNSSQSEIFGGNSVADAAKIFTSILDGKGTEAQNNVVLTNAAFALKIVSETKSFEAAYEEAKNSLFGLKAKECLKYVN